MFKQWSNSICIGTWIERRFLIKNVGLNLTMNDSYEINRGLFLTQLCAVVATAALIGSTLKAETPAAGTQEDAPNTHNMLVVGTEAVFLSHLPMFDGLNKGKSDYTSPHRYQVILQASLNSGGKDVTPLYFADRQSHPAVKMYSVSPAKVFVLPQVAAPAPLTSFQATVFQGHLERGAICDDFPDPCPGSLGRGPHRCARFRESASRDSRER